MSRPSKALLLEQQIELLVKHFGIDQVQASVARASSKSGEQLQIPRRKIGATSQKPSRPTIAAALESIHGSAPEKWRLLNEFLSRLTSHKILPESQDIRHFAQLVGLKEISGKSRKEMIPKLMRFLLEQPIERLRIDLPSASSISEQQRRMGFSVLTEKLLGKP